MLEVTSPYDGKKLGELPLATEEEVEKALALARQTHLNHPRGLPGHERLAILERLVELMKENKAELEQIAVSEGGKPLVDTKVEVDRAIQGVKLATHELHHLSGTEIPMGLTPSSAGRVAFTTREPIGVVVSLSAFNHPLNLIVHQVVPAVAVGCPVIVKPARLTPLSCKRFVELLHEAGLPPEWCQFIVCGNALSEKLASDERIGFMSFIGSAGVGWYLRSKLAPGTRCALEHGGVAPVIVEADAEVEGLINPLARGGFYHAGQVCVSVQRVFVQESKLEEVAEALKKRALELKTGDPLEADTDVGPLIAHKETDRVEQWVNAAGVEPICGGKRLSDSCYSPTVLVNPSAEADVSTKEVFGPVICLYGYKDRSEAIRRSNSLPFAFQASVYTRDIEVAFDTVEKLNATAVMVNDHTAFRVDWMPFGGRDHSGMGLGGIGYTMHDMTRDKMAVIRRF